MPEDKFLHGAAILIYCRLLSDFLSLRQNRYFIVKMRQTAVKGDLSPIRQINKCISMCLFIRFASLEEVFPYFNTTVY